MRLGWFMLSPPTIIFHPNFVVSKIGTHSHHHQLIVVPPMIWAQKRKEEGKWIEA
jgi:hypothetical protein